MTLNQLTYFYHAATLQHFNQAAEKANISEPSLSRSIAALEADVSIRAKCVKFLSKISTFSTLKTLKTT